MCITVSRNRINSAAFGKDVVETTMLAPDCPEISIPPRHNRRRIVTVKRIPERASARTTTVRSCRRFYPIYRSDKAVAWLFDAVSHQFFLESRYGGSTSWVRGSCQKPGETNSSGKL